MKNFGIILGHYFLRFFRDWKEAMLLIIIPVGLMIVYSFFEGPVGVLEGYNIQTSFTMPVMMLGFQFFAGSTMMFHLYPDIRGPKAWRLRAVPQSLASFVAPAFFANLMFSLLIGIIIVAVGVVFLDAYVGSYLIMAITLVIMAIVASFTYMIIFLFVQKKSVANGLVYIISFGQFILSGFLFVPLGDNAISRFLMSYGTPLSLGSRAIYYSGELRNIAFGPAMREGQDWFNIGILAAIAVLMAIVTMIIGKVKKI